MIERHVKRLDLSSEELVLWAPRDSNPEPTDYESGALTVELGAHIFIKKACKVISCMRFLQGKWFGFSSHKPLR